MRRALERVHALPKGFLSTTNFVVITSRQFVSLYWKTWDELGKKAMLKTIINILTRSHFVSSRSVEMSDIIQLESILTTVRHLALAWKSLKSLTSVAFCPLTSHDIHRLVSGLAMRFPLPRLCKTQRVTLYMWDDEVEIMITLTICRHKVLNGLIGIRNSIQQSIV